MSHSESTPMIAQPTMTAAMVVGVIPASRAIQPTSGEMMPATPKFVAPTIDCAVPAALPCRSSASTCTHGKVKPHAVMKTNSGMIVPQSPKPSWSVTMMADAATTSTAVDHARTHCGSEAGGEPRGELHADDDAERVDREEEPELLGVEAVPELEQERRRREVREECR